MKRFLIFTIITAGIAVVLFRIISSGSDSESVSGRGKNSGPVAVRTENVKWGLIEEKREFSGTVKPAYSYVIAAKISGRLVKIKKRIGDWVKQNESVGKIDDTEYRQNLQEAEALVKVRKASVEDAKAQLNHSLREKGRINELLSKGIASQAELDEIETMCVSHKSRFDLAEAQLAQSEATLAQARTKYAYTTLRAARDGFIAERHSDGGALLSINTPVFTVVGIDTVYIEIGVTERDYMQIRKGQEAQVIVDAIPNKTFKGNIARISPLFKSDTRTAVAEIAISNDSLLLKPGMFAKISLTISENDSAQLVSTLSVVSRDNKEFVFVIDKENKSRMLPVSVGISNSNKTEILSPLLKNKIITIGQHLLVDGSLVIDVTDSVKARGEGDRK